MNAILQKVTERIERRSAATRQAYEAQMRQAEALGISRAHLSCGNLAHGFAGCAEHEKRELADTRLPNIGIVSAYNDMLSAHKTYEHYPEMLRRAAVEYGAVAQVAGCVPAMCDGVTQGQPGMDLSLLSRDVIAYSTAIALSHNMFDGVLCLGICDKIVPGLLIGALHFGHLPTLFVPGGPMRTGISNDEKAEIRQKYAQGLISRAELLAGEAASYHSAGTCTFYGTANSNQMLMEIMGLHLPGSSFVNPDTELRQALNAEAVRQVVANCQPGSRIPLYEVVTVRSIVNSIVGLLATGGSTNHTIHLIAMARAAGIMITWEDMSELSSVVPLLARVYPNGKADINHFQAAGGMAFVMRTLRYAGLLHDEVRTVVGDGLEAYTREPHLREGKLVFLPGPEAPLDEEVLRPSARPFRPEGGIRLLVGNLGRAVVKTSAVADEHLCIEAPAAVFDDQDDFMEAFKRGDLHRDVVAVIRFQGPRQKGMPELHKLTPALGVLQNMGFRVALLTDGRMSGASGKVLSAIHCCPEAIDGGLLPKLQDGDLLRIDAIQGVMECLNAQEVQARPDAPTPPKARGTGRELFDRLRNLVGSAEEGAATF